MITTASLNKSEFATIVMRMAQRGTLDLDKPIEQCLRKPLAQVIGATRLLFQKAALVGALSMLPVMANILLINRFILVNDYKPYLISRLICGSLLIP